MSGPRAEYSSAVRDAQAAALRADGLTYRQIADTVGCSPATAYQRVQRQYARLAGPKVAEVRNRQLAEIADLRRIAYGVLEARHVTVQHGRVVAMRLDDGTTVPVPDYGPVLAAISELLRLGDWEAKLTGAYAPVRHRVQVLTQDAVEQAIARLNVEMAILDGEEADEDYADRIGDEVD